MKLIIHCRIWMTLRWWRKKRASANITASILICESRQAGKTLISRYVCWPHNKRLKVQTTRKKTAIPTTIGFVWRRHTPKKSTKNKQTIRRIISLSFFRSSSTRSLSLLVESASSSCFFRAKTTLTHIRR